MLMLHEVSVAKWVGKFRLVEKAKNLCPKHFAASEACLTLMIKLPVYLNTADIIHDLLSCRRTEINRCASYNDKC
jgi:hypothetical protein